MHMQKLNGLESLCDFDHARFGALARKLQLLLSKGDVEFACNAIREFGKQTRRNRITWESMLVDVLPVRLANSLADVMVFTVEQFLAMTDKQLLQTPNCGEGAIESQRMVRAAVLAGSPEFIENEEELYFDFAGAPPSSWGSVKESTTMQGEVKMDVMQALKVLCDRGHEAIGEIDAKIEEHRKAIVELKRMRSMLGARKSNGALTSKERSLAEGMLNLLRGESHGLRPAVIATKLTTPRSRVASVTIGKVAAKDPRFARLDDGRIKIA